MEKSNKIVLSILFMFLPWLTNAQIPENDKNWNPVLFAPLSDEFNEDNLNTSKWTPNRLPENTATGWLVAFDPAQVTIRNFIDQYGNEVKGVQFEAKLVDDEIKPIRSGYLTALQTKAYGFYQIRCRIKNYGYQYNNAFWTQNASGNCPNDYWYNEIDFFEILPQFKGEPDHYIVERTYTIKTNSCEYTNHEKLRWDFLRDNEFHTFGFEWTPNNLIAYFDGEPYSYAYRDPLPSYPLRLMIQLGFSKNGIGYLNQDQYMEFPGYFDVDYVRTYDLNKGDLIDYSTTTFNPDTYNYTVKRSISIGGGISAISVGKKVTLRAETTTLISGEFTVHNGSEFTILPTMSY